MKQSFLPAMTILFTPFYVLVVNSLSGISKYIIFMLFMGLLLLNIIINFHHFKKIKSMQRDLFYYLALLILISMSLLQEIILGSNITFAINLLISLWISFISLFCSFQYFLNNRISYDNILRMAIYLPVLVNVFLYMIGIQQQSVSGASFSGLDFRVNFLFSYGINAFGIYATTAALFATYSLALNQGSKLVNFVALSLSILALILSEARGSLGVGLLILLMVSAIRIFSMPNAFRTVILLSPFLGFILYFIPEIIGYLIPFQRDINDFTTLNNRIYYYEILFEELGTISFNSFFGHNFYYQPEEFTNFLYLSKIGVENPLYTSQHNNILQLFTQTGLFGITIFLYFIFKFSKSLFIMLVTM